MKGVEKISLKKSTHSTILTFSDVTYAFKTSDPYRGGEWMHLRKKIISRLRSLMNEERELKERRETGESSIPV